MTTIDYEQKIKDYMNSSEVDTLYKSMLINLFPELKESEDEKIRKAIKYGLDHVFTNNTTVYETTKEQCLAWLEKHGEQNPWSEEDKNMLKWVTGYLNNKMLNTSIAEERTACKNAIAWFEKLKDEQKPAETEKETNGNEREIPNSAWSDGDIVAIDCAVDVLSKDLPSLAASIERLKSLRPQSQWKPSDEQMDALYYVTNFDYGGHKATLVSLYEQLKKLREE